MGFEDGPSRSSGGGVQYLVNVPANAFTNVNSFVEGTEIVTGAP